MLRSVAQRRVSSGCPYFSAVIAGLDPAIHDDALREQFVRLRSASRRMDPRVKPGGGTVERERGHSNGRVDVQQHVEREYALRVHHQGIDLDLGDMRIGPHKSAEARHDIGQCGKVHGRRAA